MSCSGIRNIARQALARNWANALAATLLYVMLVEVPPLVLDGLFGTVYYTDNSGMSMAMNQMNAELSRSTPASQLYSLLIVGAFTYGLAMFFIAMFRKQDVSPMKIFDGFQFFGKALGLYLLIVLFVILWSFLLIIPGIIAALRYSQAFYILADDPQKPILMCINESKYLMNGNKATLFVLYLSFMGWIILSCIPGGVVLALLGMDITYWSFVACSVLVVICVSPVTTYINMTQVAFYEMLTGRLRLEATLSDSEGEKWNDQN